MIACPGSVISDPLLRAHGPAEGDSGRDRGGASGTDRRGWHGQGARGCPHRLEPSGQRPGGPRGRSTSPGQGHEEAYHQETTVCRAPPESLAGNSCEVQILGKEVGIDQGKEDYRRSRSRGSQVFTVGDTIRSAAEPPLKVEPFYPRDNDQCFEGSGRGIGGEAGGLPRPPQPCDRRFTSNESVLGEPDSDARRGAGDLFGNRTYGDGRGAGQAEFEWRERLGAQARDTSVPTGGKKIEEPDIDDFYDARSRSTEGEGQDLHEDPCLDGPCSPVPDNVPQVLRRPGGECADKHSSPAPHVQVEDLCVDASSTVGDLGRDGTSSPVEAQPEMASAPPGKAVGQLVGTHRLRQAAMPRPEDCASDERKPPGDVELRCSTRPSRGLTQKLKKGVAIGKRALGLLTLVSSWQTGWNVTEIFPTGIDWGVSLDLDRSWVPTSPLWESTKPPSPKECVRIMDRVEQQQPDLLLVVPPVGPWSTWQRDSPKIEMRRKAGYWRMWHMICRLWHQQTAKKRLMLIQLPAKVGLPHPDEMREMQEAYRQMHRGDLPKERLDDHHLRDRGPENIERGDLPEECRDDHHLRDRGPSWVSEVYPDPVYRARVDLCAFGLCAGNGRPYKRSIRCLVNDPWWCGRLEAQALCSHEAGSHQVVEGHGALPNGQLVPRAWEAACWPLKWTARVLQSAAAVLCNQVATVEKGMLHHECDPRGAWEAVPVELEQSPEGQLRQRLGEVTGQQYDYIYFEGSSGALPRQLRSTLAKLHVSLGHISAEKLKRMLHLNGAKGHILKGVSDMRCQVCQTVAAPTPAPKASFDRPQRFNERVVSDVFFVWDSRQEKYAVVHALDAFSMYQVATLMIKPQADMVAHFLKNHWINIFGPPDVFMSDAGTEYAAETESLLRAYDVHHEMVPPSAKWRMGLAERHGAVLKLLVMKTIQTTTAKGYAETKECVLAAVAARNRQSRVGGFSPTQIVLGKDVAIPSSLLEQIGTGHFKYVLNQDLSFAEARHRNEEIRYAASQAFVWADSHETLRKALNAKTRHPRHEMLYEGAMVYFYDPPSSRKGLPRRLQDQVSWMGPGTVVAIERREGAIKRVWIRYRNKLKGLPLEYVRLAALEEVEASKVCTDALKEVEKELEGGRPEIENMIEDEVEEPTAAVMEFSDDEPEMLDPTPASVLDDLPMQLHRDKRPPQHLTPTTGEGMRPKKVKFEEAKQATTEHLSKMKAVLQKYEPASASEQPNLQVGGSSSSRPPPSMSPSPPTTSHRGYGVLHVCRRWHLEEATRSQRKMIRQARRSGWNVMGVEIDAVTAELAPEMEVMSTPLNQVEPPVTGKPRLEYKWNKLTPAWQASFLDPLKKAIDVYVDNDALEPVLLGMPIPPDKILPSRFVLTNKSDKESLEEAVLKARWVLAGHLDKEAGQWATEAPTASLVAHNMVCFVCAQFGWNMLYADISAAFLQGETLDDERVVYIRLPKGYPDAVNEHLRSRLQGKAKGTLRGDVVRLIKGGFGLSESPRLWYQRLKRGLEELGLKELKLSPGTFVLHLRGRFMGIMTIHVDDLRMGFHSKAEYVLVALKRTFNFGEWRSATNELVKFCGRWEKQCPQTFKVTITMDGYAQKLQEPPRRDPQDKSPLTDAERKWVSSMGGQINWMARQGRADLAFGISKVQQMSGARDPETLKFLAQLVKKAKESYECYYQALPGPLEEMVFLAVSDASHGSMPKGRSQGGMMILVAHENVLEGPSLVNCLLYHSSVIKRVVRSSLAAEVSQAAETLEQCDFVRAMMAEALDPGFVLSSWLWSAGRWREILVMDSKTGYDVLNSISHGEDKRLAIDIAILKESLYEPQSNRWIRWVPGLCMPSDGLTKEYGNGVRDQVMRGGPWSLKDTPEAQRLREQAGHRKRLCKSRLRDREQELEEIRRAKREPSSFVKTS